MSDPNQPSVRAGWYPDGQGNQRWWDGSQWTEHTQPLAETSPAAPASPGAPGAPGAPAAPPAPPAQQPFGAPPAQPPYDAPAQPPAGPPASQPFGQPPAQLPFGQPPFGQPPAQPPFGQPPFGQPQFGPPASGGGRKRVLIIAAAVVAVLVIAGGVTAAVVLSGGSKGKTADAKDAVAAAAQGYFQAFADGDFGKACAYMSTDRQEAVLQQAGASSCDDYGTTMHDQQDSAYQSAFGDSYDSLHGATHWKVRITDTEVHGKSATVDLDATGTYDGSNKAYIDRVMGGSSTKTGSYELTMALEHGSWKVDKDEDR